MNHSINVHNSHSEKFRTDVVLGLSLANKTLPSRWLYDDQGSELFEQITRVNDYYPTRTEAAILSDFADEISAYCGRRATLVEYGAGAAVKTETVLRALDSPAGYVPIDIAGDFLATTVNRMKARFPGLESRSVVADFTQDFDLPPQRDQAGKKVAFFPGSTVGNLDATEASALLRRMHRHVGTDGRALIGFDLIKSLDILRRAYDDSDGVTAAFNLNYLARINRELDGNFPLDRFSHEARWNPKEQAMEMHLVSLDERVVQVAGRSFEFLEQESIHTESSRKYTLASIGALAANTGWTVDHAWMDTAKKFVVIGMRTLPINRVLPTASSSGLVLG